MALDVHARAEEQGNAVRPALSPERGTDRFEQLAIPAGRKVRGRGKTRCGNRVADTEMIGIVGLASEAVGTVGERHFRQPEFVDRLGRPEPGARQNRHLTLERELAQLLAEACGIG